MEHYRLYDEQNRFKRDCHASSFVMAIAQLYPDVDDRIFLVYDDNLEVLCDDDLIEALEESNSDEFREKITKEELRKVIEKAYLHVYHLNEYTLSSEDEGNLNDFLEFYAEMQEKYDVGKMTYQGGERFDWED